MSKIQNITDPRQQRSLQALTQAMTALLDEQPVSQISITQLVSSAGVSRPTFYQHFDDLHDLARFAAMTRLASAIPIMPLDTGCDNPDAATLQAHIAARTLPPLQHLARHRQFYLHVLEGSSSPALFAGIVQMLVTRVERRPFQRKSQQAAIPESALISILNGGMMWHVVNWVMTPNTPQSPQDLAQEIGQIAAALLVTPAAQN